MKMAERRHLKTCWYPPFESSFQSLARRRCQPLLVWYRLKWNLWKSACYKKYLTTHRQDRWK